MVNYYKLLRDDNAISMLFNVGKFDLSQSTFNNFVQVLSLDCFDNPTTRYLDILRKNLGNNAGGLKNFDERTLIKMLSNYLLLHGDDKYVEVDYLIISEFLQNISSSLINQIEQENEDEIEHRHTLHIEQGTLTNLEALHTSSFIQGCISLLINENLDQRKIALIILSKLINLFPTLKNKVCMLISITPNCYSWFFRTIKQDAIFKHFTTTGQDYIEKEQFTNKSFWSVVYLFQETYSYWLIVSNDLESFADDKLTINQVVEFLEFSKTLCLTLIFNRTDSKLLKNISILLLNQLYLKNLRLKFLDQEFWSPKKLTFNIDPLIRIIAEEEEKDDDESENEEIINHKISFDSYSKVEVLKKLPFFIEFKDRVRIFQALIELDRSEIFNENNFFFMDDFQNKLIGKIRRFNLLQDAFEAFGKTGSKFKNRLQVEFYNEYGPEVGIDGGGITKEFLTSVVNEGFKPGDLFKETSENQLYPDAKIYEKLFLKIDADKQQENLQYLRFLGMIVGKCLYENVLINVSFAPFFLNKWCNENLKNSINDLNYLDSELFKNLIKLTQMSSKEIDQLDLNFSLSEKIDKQIYNFELIPNGHNQQVTSMNILNYIHQLSNFKLNQCLKIQSNYFLQGLFTIISKNWLKMFDANELQMLISGNEENNVNIMDWQNNVEYGGYLENDLTVQLFWNCVEEMSMDEKFKLIKFVTSVNRAPLLGFGALNPKFGIRNGGRDISRLPTASTCVNLLKLPDYQNKEILREKLLYAINTEAGFDLS
ncbi:unnamed protein product [Candida verbasci]|uniref:HECT-type E3 ubiquitin transferase n=1 Tax=Candida verbasci TaxID=1227364 RepID=A0A9W4XEM9_9ASCO|nr:unnamed protein product [Candida verbasci]